MALPIILSGHSITTGFGAGVACFENSNSSGPGNPTLTLLFETERFRWLERFLSYLITGRRDVSARSTRADKDPPRESPMSKRRNYAWFVVAGGLIATYAVLMFVI